MRQYAFRLEHTAGHSARSSSFVMRSEKKSIASFLAIFDSFNIALQ
jgi:hypothetical protein